MLMNQRLQEAIKSRRGSTSPIILCVTVVIVIAAAFTADIGYTAISQVLLHSSAKQAAVNGAEVLLQSRKAAEEAVRQQALRSNGDLSGLDIRISDNNRELTVSMQKPFDYLFVKFFGVEKKEIETKVTVRLSGVTSFKGVRPFGVVKSNLRFGKKTVLTNKPAAGKDEMKALPLRLGGGSLENTMILGYPGKLKTGDPVEILQETTGSGKSGIEAAGLKAGIDTLITGCRHEPRCTYEKYNTNCSKIMIIPVLSPGNQTGEYHVSGFAAFFLEGSTAKGDVFHITGRFIRHAVQTDMSDSAEDYGLTGIRIIG